MDITHEWDEPGRPADEPLPESVRTLLSILADPSASDERCVHRIQETFPVEAAAPARPYTDKNGNTMLHVAAMRNKAATVSYILANYPLLGGIRNSEGYTALEAVQSRLERYRTRRGYGGATAVVSDQFKGYSNSAIVCLAALAGNETVDLATLSKEDMAAISSTTDNAASGILEIDKIRYTLRLKYGCTCGECIGGFLSPRMGFALSCTAVSEFENQCVDLRYISPHALRYVATPVRRELETNESMRQGFTDMYQVISECLVEKWLPDEETVRRFYRDKMSGEYPEVKIYLERGGTVAAIAMVLFQMAKYFDEWAGHGTHMDWDEEEIMKLPACRNDHEFDFVRAMCGY